MSDFEGYDLFDSSDALTAKMRSPHVTGRVFLYQDTLSFPLRAAYERAVADVKIARAVAPDVDDAPDEAPTILEPDVPTITHTVDVADADGIYVDSTGQRYKKDRKGARCNVDESGTRVFKFADGRKTSRPSEICSDLWDVMPRKQRSVYLQKQQDQCA